MKHRLDVNHDLVLTGSVAWVGRSSMLIQHDDGGRDDWEDADGGRVHICSTLQGKLTNRSAINRLAPETPEEQQLFDRIEAREIEKKAAASRTVARFWKKRGSEMRPSTIC